MGMRIIVKNHCAGCNKLAIVSDASEAGIIFYEPVCDRCRESAIRDSQMDAFDVMYERARANGWAD